jgi:hypothetical protein
MLGRDARGELVGGPRVARVVDGDVCAGGGEAEGDDGAEASGPRGAGRGQLRAIGGAGEGGETDREPAVTRTARLVSERGIAGGFAGRVRWAMRRVCCEVWADEMAIGAAGDPRLMSGSWASF